MPTDDPTPPDDLPADDSPPDGGGQMERALTPPARSDVVRAAFGLGPLFEMSRAASVPGLLANANRIGASIRQVSAGLSPAVAGLSGLDIALSSRVAGLHSEASAAVARVAESVRLLSGAASPLASYIEVLRSPAFSAAVANPALVGLGGTYGGALLELETTTSALLRDALLVPPALTAVQETVRTMVESARLITQRYQPDVLAFSRSGQGWHDDVAASLSAAAGRSVFDAARVIRSFEQFASAPPVLAEVARQAGAFGPDGFGPDGFGPDGFGAALAAEFPAAVRRAAVAPRESVGSDALASAVAFAVAWVQAAVLRTGRVLSPEAWMMAVIGIVGIWATLDGTASSTVDADRVIEAVESLETIRETSTPELPVATHVVIETADLHARPDASSQHVGVAYPNQGVRVEGTEGEWCRVVFVDHLVGQTQAGWVVDTALRATGAEGGPQ